MATPRGRSWLLNNRWGKRSDAISIALVVAILAFCAWKAFFP